MLRHALTAAKGNTQGILKSLKNKMPRTEDCALVVSVASSLAIADLTSAVKWNRTPFLSSFINSSQKPQASVQTDDPIYIQQRSFR